MIDFSSEIEDILSDAYEKGEKKESFSESEEANTLNLSIIDQLKEDDSVIIGDNMYDDMKIEILRKFYNTYTLENLQALAKQFQIK